MSDLPLLTRTTDEENERLRDALQLFIDWDNFGIWRVTSDHPNDAWCSEDWDRDIQTAKDLLSVRKDER